MTLPVTDLARLSELVYEPRAEQVRIAVDKLRLVYVDWYDVEGSQAALFASRDWFALVFRGTEASRFKWRDLAANFGRETEWRGPGRVHSGYLRYYTRVDQAARWRMAEVVSSDVPLYVTGHSLGGALATLYAAGCGHGLAGLVTFGAPKALNAEARRAVTCPVKRVVMPMDFAPSWQPGVYVHVGSEIRLKPVSWWPGPVSRHSVSGYVRALELGGYSPY